MGGFRLFLLLALPAIALSYCTPQIPCLEGYECHPEQYKCYLKAPTLTRPSIFLGCDRSSSDCDYFGFEYIGSYAHRPDTNEWCDDAKNVMCASKEAPSLGDPTPANEFRFMSYNIWERNLWITMDGQRERTCRFPRELAENWKDVDAITFQEVFMGGCWPDQASLRDLLAQHGFPYSTKTTSSPRRLLNGGIFIASRWPIVEEDQHVYENFEWNSWDAFAAKGVSYAKIVKSVNGVDRTYHAMGTHCQAGGPMSIKLGQSEEWGNFIRSKNIPNTEAVLMGGDFNIRLDSTDIEPFLANLGGTVPEKTGYYNFTIDREVNDVLKLRSPNDQQKILDYSLYSNNHLKPKVAQFEIINPKADSVFPICWCEVCPWIRRYRFPDEKDCQNVEHVACLGDHLPVIGKFIFE